MPKAKNKVTITIYGTQEDRERLERLAQEASLSHSTYLVRLIRNTYKEKYNEPLS